MKITININRIESPYGGGNQFANNLEDYLSSKGYQVSRNLVPKLDLILIVSSRPNPQTTSFTPHEIEQYLKVYPNTIVVHRINTCDEQRGNDSGINRTVLKVNRIAEHTVYVSGFLRDLYFSQGFDYERSHSVIYTGSDKAVFNPTGLVEPLAGEKLKVVTHHWSSNFLKGFDIYERLDYLLDREPFKSRFDFTCIGNLPLGLKFHNAVHITPRAADETAKLLRQNHFYLTGARYEPGGNHYIEAMRCGLPVLYLDSGSSGEYCAPYGGVAYNPGNFEEKLLEMAECLPELRRKVLRCPFTAERMAAEYEKLFERLVRESKSKPIKAPGVLQRIPWACVKFISRLKRAVINRLAGLFRDAYN